MTNTTHPSLPRPAADAPTGRRGPDARATDDRAGGGRPTRRARREWPVPVGLVLLSLVPALAGLDRLAGLAGGEPVTAENARFVAVPVPVVVHIVSATLYCLLGALQFVPSLRRRRARWHRTSGRALVPLGLAAALSGLWMAVTYDLPPTDGALLMVMRVALGTGMVAAIVLGLLAVRRRDIPAHRAWMARAYAIGIGAGTQVLTSLPWMLLVGPPDELTRALLLGLGWALNLVVVEIALRRGRRASRARRPGPSG